jgi:hypothetical protein
MQALGLDMTMNEAFDAIAYDARLYKFCIHEGSVQKGGRGNVLTSDWKVLLEKAPEHEASKALIRYFSRVGAAYNYVKDGELTLNNDGKPNALE